MKIQLRVIGSLLAASVLVGCGGGVSSGVDGSKPANTVTDAEAQDVCEAVISYQQDSYSTDSICNYAGLVAYATGGGVTACEDTVSQCKSAAANSESADPANSCSAVNASLVAECEVTVGDIETCLTEVIDAVADGLNSLPSCSEIEGYQPEEGGSTEPSQACQNVAADPGCAIVLQLVAAPF